MGCPAIQIANPKGASRAIPAPARRASARGPVSLRRTREKRHCYGWTASSGSYVANDPVNLTDPTGTECKGDGKVLTCNPVGDDTGTFQIPQPAGYPNYTGPDAAFPHAYRAETSSPDAGGSLTQAVTDQVIGNPTPGNDRAATAGGVVNDAGITPGPMQDLVNSYVRTDSNGNTVVVNVTIPGEHVLSPGIVAQYVIPGPGQIRIVVAGEGNGALSVPANPVAQATFQNKIERDMRTAIYNSNRR